MDNVLILLFLLYVTYVVFVSDSLSRLRALVKTGFILLCAYYASVFIITKEIDMLPFMGCITGVVFITAIKIIIYRIYCDNFLSEEDIAFVALICFGVGYMGTFVFLFFISVASLFYFLIKTLHGNILKFKYFAFGASIFTTLTLICL